MKFNFLDQIFLCVLVSLFSITSVWAHPGHGFDAYWHHVTDFAPPVLTLVALVLLLKLRKS
jgi:hypothetical protein